MSSAELRFIHDIVKPYVALNMALSRRTLVQPEEGDAISSTRSLCVALAHFPESAEVYLPGTRSSKEQQLAGKEWTLLWDIANTAKHGVRRDPTTQVDLAQALSWEFDDVPKFKFLRVVVLAKYSNSSEEYDVLSAVYSAIQRVGTVYDFKLLPIDPPLESQEPFADRCVVPFEGSSFYVTSTRLMYHMRVQGDLVRADPPHVDFVVP